MSDLHGAIRDYRTRLRTIVIEIDELIERADDTKGIDDDVGHYLSESRSSLGNVLHMLARAAEAARWNQGGTE